MSTRLDAPRSLTMAFVSSSGSAGLKTSQDASPFRVAVDAVSLTLGRRQSSLRELPTAHLPVSFSGLNLVPVSSPMRAPGQEDIHANQTSRIASFSQGAGRTYFTAWERAPIPCSTRPNRHADLLRMLPSSLAHARYGIRIRLARRLSSPQAWAGRSAGANPRRKSVPVM